MPVNVSLRYGWFKTEWSRTRNQWPFSQPSIVSSYTSEAIFLSWIRPERSSPLSGCRRQGLINRKWNKRSGLRRVQGLRPSLIFCGTTPTCGHGNVGVAQKMMAESLFSSLLLSFTASHIQRLRKRLTAVNVKKKKRKGMWMVSAALEWLRSFASRRDHSHSPVLSYINSYNGPK